MGTQKKKDQSNASALNAEGRADETVKVVDHTAAKKPTAEKPAAASDDGGKADEATAKAAAAEAAAADEATAKAAAAETAAAAEAEAKGQAEVDALLDEGAEKPAAKKSVAKKPTAEKPAAKKSVAKKPDPVSLKPIKYVGETPRIEARHKSELKATLVNLLAFEDKIEDCSDDMREWIAMANEALLEVNRV